MLSALAIHSAAAADATPESPETNTSDASSEGDTEELVLDQPDPDEADVLNTGRPAGDDDFIPSSQISEDLSVSFPVDI